MVGTKAERVREGGLSGGFQGFSPGLGAFFTALTANNDRDWFQANRSTYEVEVRQPFGALIEALAFVFATQDIPLRGDAKRSLFRIHRDVRFAKDKSPYKTNAGAILSRDGTTKGKGVLYVQVAGEDGAFLAMGFYRPEPKDLAAIRRAIADKPERWLTTEAALRKAGLDLTWGDPLARLPRGFEGFAGQPLAQVLKLRNFIVSRPIPEDRLYAAGLDRRGGFLRDLRIAAAGVRLAGVDLGRGRHVRGTFSLRPRPARRVVRRRRSSPG